MPMVVDPETGSPYQTDASGQRVYGNSQPWNEGNRLSGLAPTTPDAQAALWGVLGLQGNRSANVAQTYMEDPNAVLQRVLQFDPNAHLDPFTYYGPDGAENRQQVTFDQSKLPAPQHPGLVFSGNTPLYNPRMQTRDTNYGMVTDPRNVNIHQNDSTWLDIVGPLLVTAITAGAGGASMLGSILTKLPNVASMFSNAQQNRG
jgi:hypothetical protein